MRRVPLLFLVVIQLALGDLLRVFGWAPGLVTVAVLLLGAGMSPARASLLGFCLGALTDILSEDPLGAMALVGTTLGFLASMQLNPADKLPLPHMIGRAILLIVPAEIFLANLRFTGMDATPLSITLYHALPTAIYTLLFWFVLFLIPGLRGEGWRE